MFFSIFVIFSIACPGFGSEEAGQVTETPTFDNEIKPIFDRLCNECHGVDRRKGANLPIRYDICEDTTEKGNTLKGAKHKAERARLRLDGRPPMPPANYSSQPTPEEKALLEKWVQDGAPCNASEVDAQ